MEPARHATRARKQFAIEFAAALNAIKKLDEKRGPSWMVAPAPSPPPVPPRFDPNGKETTSALSFQAYDREATRLFSVGTKHGRPRDDFTDYCEAFFRQRNAFGDRGEQKK